MYQGELNMKKKIIYSILLVFSFFLITNTAYANTYKAVEEKNIILDKGETTANLNNRQPEIEVRSYGGTRVQKSNVRITHEWSGYRAVSHTVKASSAGASISTNRTTTFKTDVSGDISKINISLGGSISSTVGYTIQIPPGKTAYLGFRVLYKVERGTRTETFYDGKVYKKTNYVVKTPIRGEYSLIYK